MARPRRRLRRLELELQAQFPALAEPLSAIVAGRVLVAGVPTSNPHSLVPVGGPLALAQERPLRGEGKLEAALAAFSVPIEGPVALDLGAAAGGFTRVLLRRGARRVYAVDAGFGQLLGSLRQDARVVNLERTNLARLDRRLVPERVELVTADLSYLPLSRAVGQLGGIELATAADLLALVKPMYELGLREPPSAAADRSLAVERATRGMRACGWQIRGTIECPVRGSRGAVEHLVHAQRPRAANAGGCSSRPGRPCRPSPG